MMGSLKVLKRCNTVIHYLQVVYLFTLVLSLCIVATTGVTMSEKYCTNPSPYDLTLESATAGVLVMPSSLAR